MSHQKQAGLVSSQSNVVHSEGEHQPAPAAGNQGVLKRLTEGNARQRCLYFIGLTSPVNVTTWGRV